MSVELWCRDEEVAAVARLQAQAFHESSSFAPLDSLLYYVFQVLFSRKEPLTAYFGVSGS